jgi:hypothetical protein
LDKSQIQQQLQKNTGVEKAALDIKKTLKERQMVL